MAILFNIVENFLNDQEDLRATGPPATYVFS